MKNKIIICLVLVASTLSFFTTEKIVHAEENDAFITFDAVGKGINLYENASLQEDSLYSKSIFNEEVREHYGSSILNDSPQSAYEEVSHSVEEKMKYYYQNFLRETNVSGSYMCFSAKLSNELGISQQKLEEYSLDSIIYTQKYVVKKKSARLYNALDYQIFSERYLSTDYKNALNKIKANMLTNVKYAETLVDNLFYNYGTHVILNGIFGAYAEANYTLLTKKGKIENDNLFKDKIKAYISGELNKDITISATANEVFSSLMKISDTTKSVEAYQSVNLSGGSEVSFSSDIKKFDSVKQKWLPTINSSNYTMVSTIDSNGLKPIWYYVPDNDEDLKEFILQRYNFNRDEHIKSSMPQTYSVFDYRKDDQHFGGGNNKRTEKYYYNFNQFKSVFYSYVRFNLRLYIWKHVASGSTNVYLRIKNGDTQIYYKDIKETDSNAHLYDLKSNQLDISNISGDNVEIDLIFDAWGTDKSHGYSELYFEAEFIK